ncbi:MAG: metal ABC transporter ATP-binding protein [Minisyncoccia bacterium]
MILTVENLTISLDKEEILKNISFTLNQGEVLTILGPNGAGKSVLLRALLGLIPYQGKIIWDKKYRISYLPQGLNQLLFKGLPLTVEDFFRLKQKNLTREEIIKSLKVVGLREDVLNKLIGNLSGGEFQRILIAWVLIGDPEILFLDEPTTGIDIGGGKTIYTLLKQIQKERNLTIILVTHDLDIVYDFTDKVMCLAHKTHTCFGPPNDVMSPNKLEEVFGGKIKFYEH